VSPAEYWRISEVPNASRQPVAASVRGEHVHRGPESLSERGMVDVPALDHGIDIVAIVGVKTKELGDEHVDDILGQLRVLSGEQSQLFLHFVGQLARLEHVAILGGARVVRLQ
jgi:hypothetical protein